MGTLLAVLVPLLLAVVAAQGRFRSNEQNVLQHGEANIGSRIATERTTASLSCESGDMVVKINFSSPFRGIMYAQSGRLGPCRVYGDSGLYYELRIPLKGCGTWQGSPRVFSNNVTIRFHQSLELEEDETKTVICRYPPPIAYPPVRVVVSPTVSATTTAAPIVGTAGLSEVEILLIICALLFLSLLPLGLGVAYFCLKKRNIRLVRRRKVMSSGPPSDVTKLSGTTLGRLSLLDPIRIPRAVANSASGSEGALLASKASRPESVSSDYPSESGSSGDGSVATDGRHLTTGVSASQDVRQGRDNTAFTGDDYAEVSEILPQSDPHSYEALSKRIPTRMTIPKARAFEDQTVTTLLGPEELIHWRSWNRNYTIVKPDKTQAVDEEKREIPIYATVRKKRPPPAAPASGTADLSRVVQPPSGGTEVSATDGERQTAPRLQVATITDYYINTETVTEVQDTVTTRTETEFTPTVQEKSTETVVEERSTPLISVHTTDDLTVTTTTNTETEERVTTGTKDSYLQHTPSPLLIDRHGPEQSQPEDDPAPPSPVETPQLQHSPPGFNVTIRSVVSPSVREEPEATDDQKEKGSSVVHEEGALFVEAAYFDGETKTVSTAQSSEEQELQFDVTEHTPAVMMSTQVRKTAKDDEDLLTFSDDSPPSGRTSSSAEDVQSCHLSFVSEDSYTTVDSSGERSTSEVMEMVPTVAKGKIDHPGLERSTSEIVTLPEIRRVVEPEGRPLKPVLERYPASFIDSIPAAMVPPGDRWDRTLPQQPPQAAGVSSKKEVPETVVED